jgi:hypothetical protein
MYEGICDAIHKELDLLDEKYSKGTQLNMQDLETIDSMAHALKCLATYDAMKGGYTRKPRTERYSYDDGYRRY